MDDLEGRVHGQHRFEVIHKTDLYMAYRTFSLFCQNAE